MGYTILITGAGSGFGALAARALAQAGHTVYAGMRETTGRNARAVHDTAEYAQVHKVALKAIELDVKSQESVDSGVKGVLRQEGAIDVLIHNAGRLATGPSESFTPEEIADIMDTNLLGTQRLNRAVLPHMRSREEGLVIWIGSSSTKGGTPPYLAPYFAAKAAMDSFAVSYAAELTRFGIETSIVVPGPFVGTDLFAKAAASADKERAAAYDTRYPGLLDHVGSRLAALAPEDADEAMVADAVVEVVGAPNGQRPFRVHVDPVNDGSEAVSEVADRARVAFLGRLGLSDLLSPRKPPQP